MTVRGTKFEFFELLVEAVAPFPLVPCVLPTSIEVIPQVGSSARTPGEPFTKPRNAKRQETLDLVAAERQVCGPGTPDMVPCRALYQPTFQFRIPRQQGFTDFPTREPLAPAQVIETRLLTIDEFPNGSCDHTSRKRAAKLVGIERHVPASLSGSAHVFHKASIAIL